MPQPPLRPCKIAGCPELTRDSDRLCPDHKRPEGDGTPDTLKKKWGGIRASSTQRGYNSRWQRYAKNFLKRHPLCQQCLKLKEGGAGLPRDIPERTRASEVVDHIIPHRGNQELFWKPSNHQALCKKCHDRKTGKGE